MIVDKDVALKKLNSPDNLISGPPFNHTSIIDNPTTDNPTTDIEIPPSPAQISEDIGLADPSVNESSPAFVDARVLGRPDHDAPNKVRLDEKPERVSIRKSRNGGKRKGDTTLPQEIKQLLALDDTSTAKELKQALGVCDQTISNIRGPMQSGLSPQFKEAMALRVETAQDQAIAKMLQAFDCIDFNDEEKIKKTTLKDFSTIAVNMGKILEIGRSKGDVGDKTQLIVYAPEVRHVNNYNEVSVPE